MYIYVCIYLYIYICIYIYMCVVIHCITTPVILSKPDPMNCLAK